MMNQGNISSGHLTLTSSSPSSKTVAAILKQAKNQQAPKEAARLQQQQSSQGLKSKGSQQGSEQTQQSSGILSHHSISKGSPLGRVSSPSLATSPAMSPSSIRGISPLGKEHSHPITTTTAATVAATKSSSLSRDLSPSLITAQIVKVMAETTASATAAPNLLRSALQGNMPEPLSVLSNSKTEGGLVTVARSLTSYNPSNRRSPVSVSGLSSSSNSISSSHHQGHTFSKILTSIAGAGGYLSQSEVDPIDSLITTSTVENLLASSDGTIQTVNVSHIPKPMNSSSTSTGSLSGGSSSNAAAASRNSQLSAMEVAQQIKMEANGQKSIAQLAALRPGMQQQLRSQIQSSRSIDAQLTSKQTSASASFSKGLSSSQAVPSKESEHKLLETSMPLLASKLNSSSSSSATTTTGKLAALTGSSHLKQQQPQQQMTGDPSHLLPTSLGSAPSSHSSLSSLSSPATTTSSHQSRKSALRGSPGKSSIEPQQQQQNLMRQLHQPQGTNVSHSKQAQSELGLQNDHNWIHKQGPKDVVNQDDRLSSFEKQQAQDRLFLKSSLGGGLGERAKGAEGSSKEGSSHAQIVAKHLSSQHGYHRSGGAVSAQLSSIQALLGKMNENLAQNPAQETERVGHHHHHHNQAAGSALSSVGGAQTGTKYRPGESKQTAIDVDLDIGQHARTTATSVNAHQDPSVGNVHLPRQDIKHSSLHSALGHQLSSTPISATSNSIVEQAAASNSRDSHAFVPVQAVKPTTSASSSFAFHSSASSSSLAYIPKPIMHASSSSSTSSSSLTSAKAVPPMPDYAPPPPYPSRPSQQYQPEIQQQAFFASKPDQPAKQIFHNPFTFPTTGVKIDTDSKPYALLSYSVLSQPAANESLYQNEIKHEIYEDFEDVKPATSSLGKSHSDVSSVRGIRGRETKNAFHGDMPCLVPEVPSAAMKAAAEDLHNHLGEVVKEERRQLVQPFNQRVSNLSCFPVMNSTYRAAYRSHAMAVQRARSGVITNTAKSLDILRQNLQHSINKEITKIIKRYTDKYFQPALDNIKQNNSENFLGDEHINYVCRQILEEAKTEYMPDTGGRSVTPSDFPDNVSETGSLGGRRIFLKRSRISDTDSEKGSDGGFSRKIAKKKGRPLFQGSGRLTPSKPYKSGEPVKREGPKWDPERLKPETLFVMGARANKALGLGNTRGRLYIRHPDVFKYIGDQEDKLWLCEHNLMPATGGKAYMLLLEDIEDLSRSEEYKDSQGLMMHECVGFRVPEWMLVKMKAQMNAIRSDSGKRSQSRSPASEYDELTNPKILPFSTFSGSVVKEEIIVSPADTEEMDFLSTADNDDTQPSSGISPFTVTGGFEDGVSPSPSDLDPMEDPPPVPSLFS